MLDRFRQRSTNFHVKSAEFVVEAEPNDVGGEFRRYRSGLRYRRGGRGRYRMRSGWCRWHSLASSRDIRFSRSGSRGEGCFHAGTGCPAAFDDMLKAAALPQCNIAKCAARGAVEQYPISSVAEPSAQSRKPEVLGLALRPSTTKWAGDLCHRSRSRRNPPRRQTQMRRSGNLRRP